MSPIIKAHRAVAPRSSAMHHSVTVATGCDTRCCQRLSWHRHTAGQPVAQKTFVKTPTGGNTPTLALPVCERAALATDKHHKPTAMLWPKCMCLRCQQWPGQSPGWVSRTHPVSAQMEFNQQMGNAKTPCSHESTNKLQDTTTY